MSHSVPLPLTESVATWMQPPTTLIHRKIMYLVRMLGHKEVEEKIVRAAIDDANLCAVVEDACRAIKAANEKTGNPKKLTIVELSINVGEVKICDAKTKKLMHLHPLRKIMLFVGDKNDPCIVSYIAADDSKKLFCYVFQTPNYIISKLIAATICEAFNLRYMENHNEIKLINAELCKTIEQAQLEISELKAKLNFYENKYGVADITTPLSENMKSETGQKSDDKSNENSSAAAQNSTSFNVLSIKKSNSDDSDDYIII